jgi:predicted PurR-regulated permease PerM
VAKSPAAPQWQRALLALSGTVIATVVIAVLYWAQTVLIPLALALYLAFLLNPLVRALQRRGLGRIPSVIVVVAAAATLVLGFGWLMASQTTDLVNDLPNYTSNLRAKIKSIRRLGSDDGRLEKMGDELARELTAQPDAAAKPPTEPPASAPAAPPGPSWIRSLPEYLASGMQLGASFVLVFVLLIFMLLKREDLRNRFICLVGHSRLLFTTKAVDEATYRISRYLVTQAAINGAFGAVLALGLFLLGIKYALLWGLLAAILRYLPFVGIWVAAAFPTILSLGMSEGWWQPLVVIGLTVTLDLIATSFLEPWLFGKSIGVSEVGLLVMAALAAFLWGPVGLLLAAPLTACLIVIGRYVPRLSFFEILLGDQPTLEPGVSSYQRLLARDQDEAVDLVLAHSAAEAPERVYDDILIPALTYARRDRDRDELTDSDEEFVRDATRDVLEDLGEQRQETDSSAVAEPLEPIRILGCPARDASDQLALEMLGQALDPNRWQVEVAAADTLAAELIARIEQTPPALICIASLPPGGLAHTRYLCKRLRSQFPEVRILVGRWGLRGNLDQNLSQLRAAGADDMTTSILDTRSRLNALIPVLFNERTTETSHIPCRPKRRKIRTEI